MSFFSKLLDSAVPALRSVLRSRTAAVRHRPPDPTSASIRATPSHRNRESTQPADSPGRSGPDRTVEVDPESIGPVRMSYCPITDGDPDPGEIVWTWVPYEEDNGQGKDRPVLVVAAETGGTVLVVQLTSKDHNGESDFASVGAGDWDCSHRKSWANLERVLRVHPSGMRREAAALPETPFQTVADRLRSRYGWN